MVESKVDSWTELEPGDAYSLGAKRVKHRTENFNDVYSNLAHR